MLDGLIIERHPPLYEALTSIDEPTPRSRSSGAPPVTSRQGRKALAQVMTATHQEVRWAVPGLVPEGLSILAGRQKLGKSWLALDLALAVGTGGAALGSVPCDAGNVLYIDLENGERRIQRRVRTLLPNETADWSIVDRIEIQTESSLLGPEFLADLDDWRTAVELPKLVIVDVLQRIKPVGAKSRNAYENDYAALSSLQKWATEHGIAVLVIHHTRKGGADDPLEALSGSNGLSACADATLVLDHNANGTTLYVRGRDVEEAEHALLFTDGLWTVTGNAADVRRSKSRNAILDALEEAGEPMTPTEIAAVTGMTSNHVRQLGFRLKKAGEIVSVGKGRYAHPRYTGGPAWGPTPRATFPSNPAQNPESEPEAGVTEDACNAQSSSQLPQTVPSALETGLEDACGTVEIGAALVIRNAVTRSGGRHG